MRSRQLASDLCLDCLFLLWQSSDFCLCPCLCLWLWPWPLAFVWASSLDFFLVWVQNGIENEISLSFSTGISLESERGEHLRLCQCRDRICSASSLHMSRKMNHLNRIVHEHSLICDESVASPWASTSLSWNESASALPIVANVSSMNRAPVLHLIPRTFWSALLCGQVQMSCDDARRCCRTACSHLVLLEHTSPG